MSNQVSRRRLIATLPAAGMALVASGVSRVDAKELDLRDFLAKASPIDRAWYHANALADCMNAVRPGFYTVHLNIQNRIAMIADNSGG
ncbi:MAG TPA: hypothetical protein VHP34_11295 [Alphaproteobacteria bacterium]|nr:hypothetical protein [Alphaproteobacteria bacterium]